MFLFLPKIVLSDTVQVFSYTIDYENSMSFSKKIANANNMDLNKFFSIGSLKRDLLANDYIKKNKIVMYPPKFVFSPDCKKDTYYVTFDDYRLEIAHRYSSSIAQAVNSEGHYLPFVVCKQWE